MIVSIVTRIVQAVPVLIFVGFICFALFNFVGDPVSIMLGPYATEAERADLYGRLGLDQPFLVQYARYMGSLLHGEFGISYQFAQPVTKLILERMPATLELVLAATLISIILGVPIGIYTGVRPNGFFSNLLMSVSLLGISLPTFFVGILLILIFAVELEWLPSFGRGEVVRIGFWSTGFLTASGLQALVLPAVTLGTFQMTLIIRLVRSEFLEVMRTDFIRFGRARGLSERSINFSHALRNAMIPVITVLGLQIGNLIAFSLVTETVFQWPGMGAMLVQALGAADIPVIAAYLMLISLIFVAINLIVDLTYLIIDPRLRGN